MLVLILAEAAVETVPPQLWRHPAVASYAKERGKTADEVLLDRSYHHSAMRLLGKDGLKRGRPDITHFALLEALGSPLNREGLLETYVHTVAEYMITVNPKVRLPRNYDRFVGLLEQLFKLRRVPPKGEPLLSLEQLSLAQLIKKVSPTHVLAFSRTGKPQTLEKTLANLHAKERLAAIVGGFPHGEFTEATLKLADEVVAIDAEPLETWTVVSRLIYEYEKGSGLPEKRLRMRQEGHEKNISR